MLAEMLAAGLNANLGGRDHIPIEVERQIVEWTRQMFGFPAEASGIFVTGTSMANLMAVLVARTAALGESVRHSGIADAGASLTAYTSTAAHGCIAKAMDLAGFGSDALRKIETDRLDRIDVAALRLRIAQDRAAGLKPFLVVGSAGTVDMGAIDDLRALSARYAASRGSGFTSTEPVARLQFFRRYGAAARRAGTGGLDRVFDFHKWGQVPYDAGFLMVRDGNKHRATFAAPAAYLRRDPRASPRSQWPCDLGPDLSRGFRALKTWFTLKMLWRRQARRHDRAGAARSQDILKAGCWREPCSELLAPAQLNIVCFSDTVAQMPTR